MDERLINLKFTVSEFLSYLVERGRTLDAKDWIIAKTCLITGGTILGASFSKFFKKIRPLLTLIFAVTWVISMIKVFEPVIRELKRK